VLSAKLESDRVWIKRPFAGCRAGYQVRFRSGPGRSPSRFALAVSFTDWLEMTSDEAALYRVTADDRVTATDRFPFERTISGGVISVFPRAPHTLIFLDETLLFSAPESVLRSAEGLQIGASGGAVSVDSVRVKDRSR
jgi:hypothetical protein